MPKRENNDRTGRIGLHETLLAVERHLRWIGREQPISDVGIDAHIEVVDGREVTGQLIAAQIKGGASQFDERTDDGWIYRGDRDHLEYWLNHSLPVIVVLADTDTGLCYWQSVDKSTIEYTPKAWKLTVPKANKLDGTAIEALRRLAVEGSAYDQRLTSLVLAKHWMELVASGQTLLLYAEEWINKSSGRGSLTLFVRHRDGSEEQVQDWPFVMFPGAIYAIDVFPRAFPWAGFSVDDETYEPEDEASWNAEEGVYDSEEGRIIMHRSTFADWRSKQARVRPYSILQGEVAVFKLRISLNELGHSFLLLDQFLSNGRLPRTEDHGRVADYRFGLKAMAREYGIHIPIADIPVLPGRNALAPGQAADTPADSRVSDEAMTSTDASDSPAFVAGFQLSERRQFFEDIWRYLGSFGDFAIEILTMFNKPGRCGFSPDRLRTPVDTGGARTQEEAHDAAWEAGLALRLWVVDANSETLALTQRGNAFQTFVRKTPELDQRLRLLRDFWAQDPEENEIKPQGEEEFDFPSGPMTVLYVERHTPARVSGLLDLFLILSVTTDHAVLLSTDTGVRYTLNAENVSDADVDASLGFVKIVGTLHPCISDPVKGDPQYDDDDDNNDDDDEDDDDDDDGS